MLQPQPAGSHTTTPPERCPATSRGFRERLRLMPSHYHTMHDCSPEMKEEEFDVESQALPRMSAYLPALSPRRSRAWRGVMSTLSDPLAVCPEPLAPCGGKPVDSPSTPRSACTSREVAASLESISIESGGNHALSADTIRSISSASSAVSSVELSNYSADADGTPSASASVQSSPAFPSGSHSAQASGRQTSSTDSEEGKQRVFPPPHLQCETLPISGLDALRRYAPVDDGYLLPEMAELIGDFSRVTIDRKLTRREAFRTTRVKKRIRKQHGRTLKHASIALFLSLASFTVLTIGQTRRHAEFSAWVYMLGTLVLVLNGAGGADMIQRFTDGFDHPRGFLACALYFFVWLSCFVAWMFPAAHVLQRDPFASALFWTPWVLQGLYLTSHYAQRGMRWHALLDSGIVMVHISTAQMAASFWKYDSAANELKLSSMHYIGNLDLTLDQNNGERQVGIAKISVPTEGNAVSHVSPPSVLVWFKQSIKSARRLKRCEWKSRSSISLGMFDYEKSRCLPKLIVE